MLHKRLKQSFSFECAYSEKRPNIFILTFQWVLWHTSKQGCKSNKINFLHSTCLVSFSLLLLLLLLLVTKFQLHRQLIFSKWKPLLHLPLSKQTSSILFGKTMNARDSRRPMMIFFLLFDVLDFQLNFVSNESVLKRKEEENTK